MNRRDAVRMTGMGLGVGLATAKLGAAPEIRTTIAPLETEFVYEALVSCAPAVEIGQSSHGLRRYIPITGGTFAGPAIKGTVLAGGADWQTERPDGVLEVDALYSMKTDDGAVLIVHNRGILSGPYFRTIPQFEAPKGPHDWLNKAIFVGSVAIAPHPGAVIIRVFRVI